MYLMVLMYFFPVMVWTKAKYAEDNDFQVVFFSHLFLFQLQVHARTMFKILEAFDQS